MKLDHVLKSQQFSKQQLEKLFRRADKLERQFNSPHRRKLKNSLNGKLLFNVFYEPSTRTRMSFAAAAHHLGMNVVETENAKLFSSAIKGESLEDTVRVLNSYLPDVIVIRHHLDGEIEETAKISSCPIINAGDGQGQHPTQALLDLYTIWKEIGRLADIRVMICGDLAHGRTVRSLVYLLSKFANIEFVFFTPETPDIPGFFRMKQDLKEHLDENEIKYTEISSGFDEALPQCDVVYITRMQLERFEGQSVDYGSSSYAIDASRISRMKDSAILMHPLPRNTEIHTEVDTDPRSVYFKQAGYGMFVRMALLQFVLGR